MMLKEIKKTRWAWFCLFVVLFLLALFTLDYSSLSTFSLALGKEVVRGLSQPNWAFLYDGSGEDLVSLLLLTLAIACLGTMIATVFAIPIAWISASNLWHSAPWVAKIGKMICNVLRAFPELVYAIIFVKIVGPGPFAGVMAIGIHQIGMLGKLFTEEMEAMNDHLIEESQAVGANFWQTMFFVRVPYLAPIYSSFALNHFEIAVRSAATLGLVGAGGIGAPLIFAIQTRTWSKVSIILLGVVVTVFILDQLTGIIRKKLR